MKLKDIDLRVWDNESKEYNQEREVLLSSNGSIYRIHTITGELEQLKDESLEVEFWTGYRDLNNAKIYEGDILRYYRESEYKPFVDYCVVCVNYKVDFKTIKKNEAGFLTEIKQEAIYLNSEIIGNIHESKDL